jgi:hypothetical protein
MVERAAKIMRDHAQQDVWDRARVRVALRTGIYFLLRRSEFLGEDRKTKMGLPRSCLLFFTKDGHPILYHDVGSTLMADSVHLNVRFSKVDQDGYGRILQHRRQVSGSCIVKDLEEWISLTRDKYKLGEEEELFHLPGRSRMTGQVLGEVMKLTAVSLGLDSSRVSAHSLRYGGATMLAAGLPQYVLAYYGGWSETSSSLRLYSGPGTDTIDQVSAHMSRMASEGVGEAVTRDHIRKVQIRSLLKHDGRKRDGGNN